MAESGVCSAGLTTIVHLAASAGPSLRVIIACGVYGVMHAVTPTGLRKTRMRLFSADDGTVSP